MVYRMLLIRPDDGTIVGDEEAEFQDDAAAISYARKFLADWAFQVWQGNRLVTSRDHDHSEASQP